MQLDRTFDLELAFLNFVFERMLADKVHKDLLASLPSESVVLTVRQACDRVAALRLAPQFVAAGPTCSNLFRSVLVRSEMFYNKDIAAEESSSNIGKLVFRSAGTKKVFGKEAIKYAIAELEARMADPHDSITLDALRPLRTFDWLLTDPQRAAVSRWIGEICARVESGGQSVGSWSAAASSAALVLAIGPHVASGSSALAHPLSKTKAQVKKDQKQADTSANMLKLFSGKRAAQSS